VNADWQELQTWAEQEVQQTLRGLPGPLREKAGAVTVTFEERPNAEQIQDGIESDTLGLFVGCEYSIEGMSDSPLPPQIILYLRNLFEFAEESEEYFREEVRTTYMHELGHYLGLDEDDLFDRGLD